MQQPYTISQLCLVLHDEPLGDSAHKHEILLAYHTDLYKLLLIKLARFEASIDFSKAEADKVKNMLNELIGVKELLAKHTIE